MCRSPSGSEPCQVKIKSSMIPEAPSAGDGFAGMSGGRFGAGILFGGLFKSSEHAEKKVSEITAVISVKSKLILNFHFIFTPQMGSSIFRSLIRAKSVRKCREDPDRPFVLIAVGVSRNNSP